jgi:hypothetical protein
VRRENRREGKCMIGREAREETNAEKWMEKEEVEEEEENRGRSREWRKQKQNNTRK